MRCPEDPEARPATGLQHGATRYIILRVTMTVLFAVVLFAAAGRFDWTRGWLYVGAVLLGETLSAVVLLTVNREVLDQRGTTMRTDTKGFDKVILPVWFLIGNAAALVAGLDAGRFGSSWMPLGALYLGAGLTATGYMIGTWAMAVNLYFEPTVRIQRERGHEVVTSGPYHFVRHPGYVGAILGALASPLFLGSAWMFVPVGGVVVLFVIRTALEDETLQRELPGYREYAHRTRYRLLPGVW